MAQNEYDVNIKLNLENSVTSFDKELSEIETKMAKKQAQWRREYQKSIQGKDLTDGERISGQIEFVSQKANKAWSYKKLEREQAEIKSSKTDAQSLLSQLKANEGKTIDAKTIDKMVEENLSSISRIVTIGQKLGAEVESLGTALEQVKAKREQLKSFEKIDIGSDAYKKKVSSSKKATSTIVVPTSVKKEDRNQNMESAEKNAKKNFDLIMGNAKKYKVARVLDSQKEQDAIMGVLQQQELARQKSVKITLPRGKINRTTKQPVGRSAWGYTPRGEIEEGKGSLSTRFSSAALFENGKFFNPVNEDGSLKTSVIIDAPGLKNEKNFGGVGDLRNASLSELENAYSRLIELANKAESRGTEKGQKDASALREYADTIVKSISEAVLNTANSEIVTQFTDSLTSNKRLSDYNVAMSESAYAPYRNSPLAGALRQSLGVVADQNKISVRDIGQDTFTTEGTKQSDPQQVAKDAQNAADKVAMANKESNDAFESLKEGLLSIFKVPKSEEAKKAQEEAKQVLEENLDEIAKTAAEQILNLSGIDLDRKPTTSEIEGKLDRKIRTGEDVSFVAGDLPKYRSDEGDSRETIFDRIPEKNAWGNGEEKEYSEEEEKAFQAQLLEEKRKRSKRVAGGDEDWQRMQDAVRQNQGDKQNQTELQGNELVVTARERLQWLASFVERFDRGDLAEIITKVSTGGMSSGMDIDTVANSISKILSYPEILMSSIENSRKSLNEARTANGLEEIGSEQFTKDFFSKNPDLEARYNESLAAKKRFFNNDTGEFDSEAFSAPEEAIQRFFKVEGQINTGVNQLITGLQRSYESLEDITVKRQGKDKEGKPKEVTESAQDWVKQIIHYRTDPSGTFEDPNAGLNRAFYAKNGIKGEDVNWNSLDVAQTPALKTGLQYKAGLSGAVYGGSTIEENIASAKEKLAELEKDLEEFQKQKEELIAKQDEVVDSGSDDEVNALIQQLSEYDSKIKETSSYIEMHKNNLAALEEAQKPSSYKPRKRQSASKKTGSSTPTPTPKKNYNLEVGGSFSAKNSQWGDYSGTITSITGEGANRKVVAQVNGEEKTFLWDGLQKQIISYEKLSKAAQEAAESKQDEQKKSEEVKKQAEEEQKAVDSLNDSLDKHETKVQDAAKAEEQKIVISKELVEQLKNNEVKAVQESSGALDAHSKPSTPNSVTIKAAKIKSYDDKTHTYIDENDGEFKSLTTLARYLKGSTNNPTWNEDAKRIRAVMDTLNSGEVLTPDKVGMNTKDFNSMTHTLGAIEQGNLQHEVIDLLAKTGAKSIEELKNSDATVESKWGADGKEMENGQTRQVKASEEYARVLQEKTEFLRKLGIEDAEQKMLESTKAYMQVLDDFGVDLTKFSEIPMAATLSGSKGDYSFAFTPDQIGINPQTGENYILDSKTGKTFGTESFQLAGQKFGILANKDNPEFQSKFSEIYKDKDFNTYIAKIDGQFTQLIEDMGLSLEEFYDLVVKAFDISEGKSSPLTKDEKTSLMSRMLQTGRVGTLNTSDDGKTQSQNLTLNGGTFVSYAEGSKEENKVVREYLSELAKKLNYQKQVAAVENQIRELSKDGTKGSEEQLVSLNKQKDLLIKAAQTQKDYMVDKRLEKKTVEVNGAKQTRIGNVILSESAANQVNSKDAIANFQAEAAQERSAQTARKASTAEQKKELDNLIKQQQLYLELKEQEFELERQLQGATGQKAEEIQNSLDLNRQIQQRSFSEFTTGQIDANGNIISNEADYNKIKDKIKEIKGLSEQTIVELQNKTNNMFDSYDQKIQKFRQKYAQSAGSNTVNTSSLITQYLKAQEQRGKLEIEKQRAVRKGQNLSGTQAIENRAFVGSIDRQISQIDNTWKYDAAQKSLNGQALTEEEINRLETERGRIIAQNNQQLSNMQTNLSNSKSFLEKMADNFVQSFKQIGSYLMSMFSFQGIQRVFTNLVSRTSELDSKMVDLQIASGYSRDEIKRMMQDFNKLGKEIGKTTTEIAEAANDWLRAGYEGSEASQLTEASMNLATLGMINSSDATSYLISVLKGWKLEASEIDGVVDKLVKTDMAAAISAGDLAEAMSRANNSAQMAGSSLDRYIGYLTTMTDVTQKSAASIGESMKTVYSRFQNVAAGKFVAAQSDIESENYNEEDWANLNIWVTVA